MRSLRGRTTTLVGALALAVALSACGPAVPSWVFSTVDDGASTPTATEVGTTSATVIWAGQPHLFYSDSNGALRHKWLDGFTWRSERPFPGSSAGTTPTAIVFEGKLHLFYTDFGSDTLYHRVYTSGVGWSAEQNLGGGGASNPTTAVEYGQLHVFTGNGGRVLHLWTNDGTTFSSNSLDGDSALGGRTTDAVGGNGISTVSFFGLHVFYSDDTTHTLRHAWFGNSTWNYETLDGAAGPTGQGGNAGASPASVVYGGGPHVFYRSDNGGSASVRHAWYANSSWHFEYLDGPDATRPGHATATTLVPGSVILWNGQIDLFYGNGSGSSTLRHTFYNPRDGWHFQDFPGQAFTASTIAPAVVNGRPWIVFSNAGPDLALGIYG